MSHKRTNHCEVNGYDAEKLAMAVTKEIWCPFQKLKPQVCWKKVKGFKKVSSNSFKTKTYENHKGLFLSKKIHIVFQKIEASKYEIQ